MGTIRCKNIRLPDFDPKEILSRGDFLATGTLIRADVLNQFGPYRCEIINSGLENYEFIIQLLCNGVSGLHISEELFSYRRHSRNLSEIKRDTIIQNGKQQDPYPNPFIKTADGKKIIIKSAVIEG